MNSHRVKQCNHQTPLPAVFLKESDVAGCVKSTSQVSQLTNLFYGSYQGLNMRQTPSCSTLRALQYCPAAVTSRVLTPHLISAFSTYHLQRKDKTVLVDD